MIVLVVLRCDVLYSTTTRNSALYTFLPLVVTVTINSLISVSLVTRETQQDRAGCAGCRLQGGACQSHQDWLDLSLSREKDKLDKLLKMKTVRMTVATAFAFLLCQVIISVSPQIFLTSRRSPPPYSG